MINQPMAAHIFISHSSADAAFVKRLSADLQRLGAPIWVDHERLKPGTRNWEKAIREALKKSRALIYVASPMAAQSDYVQDELSIAEMEGCTLLASWAAGEDKRWLDCTPLGYGKLQNADMRGEKYEAGLQELLNVWNTLPTKTIAIALTSLPEAVRPAQFGDAPRNPYKALDAFTEEDTQDFFGRDELIASLLKDVTDYPSFLAVIGASGSGKSSVVMAGLIPKLRQEHPDWIILPPVKPGAHPIDALAVMLYSAYFQQGSIKDVRADLEDEGAHGLVNRTLAIPHKPKARVVLLVDQFEEVFTQTVSEQEREQFINILTSAATEPDSIVTVILTLRADFFDRPLSNSELGKLIRGHSEAVLSMSISDLRQTIEKPADQAGLSFEDGLVADLVFDTRGQVGGLPLLQYALDQLFQQRNGRWLTHAAYLDSGGVKRALAKHAEATYNKLPSEDYQRLTQALFLRLIEPGATEQDTTRRRALMTELELPDANQTNIIQECANTFVNARLLTTNEIADGDIKTSTIEVSHEALIRAWTRLGDWLSEARGDILIQQKVIEDAAAWVARGRKPDDDSLYRGAVLEESQAWADRNIPNTDEIAFIEASTQAEAERRRQDAIIARRVQNLGRATIGAALVGLIVLILLGLSINQGIIQAHEVEQGKVQINNIGQTLSPVPQTLTPVQQTLQAGNAKIAAAQIAFGNANAALTQVVGTQISVSTKVRNSQTQNDQLQLAVISRDLSQSHDYVDRNDAVLLAIRALKSGYSQEGEAALDRSLDGYYLPQLLTDGPNNIEDVAYSRDGKFVLTGSDDGIARTWDVTTGQVQQVFKGHTDRLTSVAFAPDGRFVLTGSADRTMRLWEASTGRLIRIFSGHNDALSSVTFSADGRTILSASTDRTAKLWDVNTGETIRTFSGHADAVRRAVFSPDEKYVFTGSDDRTARLWETSSGLSLRTFSGHTAEINSVAFSPDGKTVLTCSLDKTARLWDVTSGEVIYTFTGHDLRVNSGAFSPDGHYVITSSTDRTARYWDITNGQVRYTFKGHTASARSVVLSPDGHYALTGSDDSTARLWDLTTGQLVHIFGGHADLVTSTTFSPDGRYALTGSVDHVARLWDTSSGQLIRTLSGHLDAVTAVTFSPNGQYILTGSADHTAQLWAVSTGQPIRTFNGHTDAVLAVAFSPDSQYVLTGSADHTARLWDIRTAQAIHTFSGHTDRVVSTAFSPDSKYILTGSADHTARLWEVGSWQAVRTLTGHTDTVMAVAFSPDSQYILTGSADRTAGLWDMTTGKRVRTFSGHTDRVAGVTFSPDGKVVLTASADRTARLWETSTGRTIRSLSGHLNSVNSVAFSPDGRYALTGSDDRTVRLWLLDYRDMITYLCTWLTRDFTEEERQRFQVTDSAPTCPQFADKGMPTPILPVTVVPEPTWTPNLATVLPTLTPTALDSGSLLSGTPINIALR
ncbi:MAG: TIR domain-containing protein [Chloroflexota bacterium]